LIKETESLNLPLCDIRVFISDDAYALVCMLQIEDRELASGLDIIYSEVRAYNEF
jgi:hypothetical protein